MLVVLAASHRISQKQQVVVVQTPVSYLDLRKLVMWKSQIVSVSVYKILQLAVDIFEWWI